MPSILIVDIKFDRDKKCHVTLSEIRDYTNIVNYWAIFVELDKEIVKVDCVMRVISLGIYQ